MIVSMNVLAMEREEEVKQLTEKSKTDEVNTSACVNTFMNVLAMNIIIIIHV